MSRPSNSAVRQSVRLGLVVGSMLTSDLGAQDLEPRCAIFLAAIGSHSMRRTTAVDGRRLTAWKGVIGNRTSDWASHSPCP